MEKRWGNGQVGRKYQTNHSLSKSYEVSASPYVSRMDCLSELGKVRMRNIPPCSWWFRPSESRKYFEKCTTGALVLILKSTRRFLKLGRFYWVRCREDVENWCKKCTTCAAVKGSTTKARWLMHQYNVGSPFERIAVDTAGPFPVTEYGNKYIMIINDYFSKMARSLCHTEPRSHYGCNDAD